MSVRLTNDLRDKIQAKLLQHKFVKPLEKLADKRARFANKVYNDVYSKKERDLMESLPDGWIGKDDDININFQGQHHRLAFNGGQSRYSCHNEISVRAPHREAVHKFHPARDSYHCVKAYAADHKLCIEFQNLQDEEQNLHEAVHAAMSQSKAALYSVNTLKQLLELWPEVEEFIPEYALRQDTTGKKNLPAIPVDDLNASFGLKRKAA